MAYTPRNPEIALARNVVAAYVPSETLEKIDFDAHLMYAEAVLERPEGARQMPAGSLEAFLALLSVAEGDAVANALNYIKSMPVENTTGTGIEDVVRALRDVGRYFNDVRAKTPLDRALETTFGPGAQVEPFLAGCVVDADNHYHEVPLFAGAGRQRHFGDKYGRLEGPLLVTRVEATALPALRSDYANVDSTLKINDQDYLLQHVILRGVDLLWRIQPSVFGNITLRHWHDRGCLSVTASGWKKART